METPEIQSGLPNEERLAIAGTLEAGGAVSFALLATGLALQLYAPSAGRFLLHAGIVVLLGTPAARILTATRAYYRGDQKRYVILCSISLFVIMLSIAVGLMYPRN